MPEKLFVVTGCGRSGTGYVAGLLTALGAPCGHEAVFNPVTFHRGGTVVWPERVAGDSSWLAAPILGKLPARTVVFHQVREPLAVIRSFLRIRFFEQPSPYRDFVERHLPETRMGGPTVRCMRYWLEWNRMAESAQDYEDLAYGRHRLEDLEVETVRGLCSKLGLQRSPDIVERVLRERPRNYNTRGDKSEDRLRAWDDLPAGVLRDDLEELARSYGYDAQGEEMSDGRQVG